MVSHDTTVTHVDGRLWALTKGVRGRMGATVAVGMISTVVGVARLALLGWLLGQVFRGAPLRIRRCRRHYDRPCRPRILAPDARS